MGRGAELDLLGVGVDTFWPANLPVDLSFAVALRFRGTREEFESEHEIEAYVLGPEMSLVGDLSFKMGPVDFPAGQPHGWEFTYIEPIVVVFTVEHYGIYVLDVYMGETERASIFVEVREP